MSSFWQDRRVFVTGCTGLVGSWTVASLLQQGAHVIGLIRDHVPGSELVRSGWINQIDIVHGSVENYELMERALAEYEVQTVFHLAAQTIVGIANRSPLSTFETNIKGTWTVLEAARRCGYNPDVIVASSDKAYGDQEKLPYTEDSPLQGRHPYDVSKSCADLLALSYHNTYRLPVCVTRCGNFYGGGDLNWNRLVPGTIRLIIRNQRPILRSDGTLIRDYFYVKDGAYGYLHLAECLAKNPEIAGEAFNFSNEIQLTALQMVNLLLQLMRSDLTPDIRAESKHEIQHQYLSAQKARTLLNWQPKYNMEDALLETISWYRSYLDLPIKDTLRVA
jgi:CDP-glucose 4,6-dehydratase